MSDNNTNTQAPPQPDFKTKPDVSHGNDAPVINNNPHDDGFEDDGTTGNEVLNTTHSSNDIGAGSLDAQGVEQEYIIFRLQNTSRRGEVFIDGTTDCINPKTGKKERARLLKGVGEIWMREQKELEKDYVIRNRRSLRFINKICRIPITDTAAIEVARIHPGNIDGPNKGRGAKYQFIEWNAKRQEEAQLAKSMQRIKAIQIAAQVPEDQMRKHAIYLNVQLTDDIGELLTPAGIRSNYMLYADQHPENFLKTVNSEEVELGYLVKKAIRDSRIDLHREPNKVYWSDGGFITAIPVGRSATKFLEDLAITKSPEGIAFKKQLQTYSS